MSLFSGARLGPYEIIGLLGSGGMGEVYRAKDPRLSREVAVKVLPASLAQDPDRLRRFEHEARAAGVLNHPNITAVYDIGQHEGAPYVVQELLEGETLRSQLVGGRFSPRKAIDYAVQIARGLAAAHEKGIVHRDLKPENLLVTNDGRLKILDFGLAKLTHTDQGSRITGLPTETAGTEPGVVLGTIGYMSPEQVKGLSTDVRSDIFSFGAILYEMLSGKRAFHGDSAAETISAILKEDPPDLSVTNKSVSPALERIVRHCLEKSPERRFHSAHDLAFDLEALSDVSAPAAQVKGPTRDRRAKAVWLIAGVLAVLAAVAAVAILQRSRAKAIDSLAVLPFADAGADPNAEYLGDGITDALINSLSQLPNLTVMSRDSVSHYKGRETSAQAAGRELKVQAVLKGKFVRRGENLFITTELVDVRNNSHLWGGQFNRRLSDIQAVQEEIAGQISAKLRGRRLTGEEKKRLTKRYTENPEAYQLYLKGRYHWEQRTEEPIKKSIEYFNQAIEKDPGYALAYAGLADAYAVSGSYSFLSPRDSMPKARAAAEKALEIDDSLAQAHATLGFVLWSYDWDFATAEGEFKKAISLDSRYATAHHWYGLLLISLGRSDEAIAQLQRAREIDPFSAIIQANVARAYSDARQYDRAIEEGRRAPENFPPAHRFVAEAYAAKGMPEQAVSEYQKAADLAGRNPQGLLSVAMAHALAGRRSEAHKTIAEMNALGMQRYVSPAYVAYVYAALDDKNQTFEYLEKAYADHSFDLLYLGVYPGWDRLRADPRFADLLRRLKLAS